MGSVMVVFVLVVAGREVLGGRGLVQGRVEGIVRLGMDLVCESDRGGCR